MTRGILKTAAASLAATAVLSTAAWAGGYSRGTAHLDPLMDEGGRFSGSLSRVAPSRRMHSINGRPAAVIPAGASGTAAARFTDAYTVLSATTAIDVADRARCAGSLAQPYGAVADYGSTRLLSGVSQTTSTELTSWELGLSCTYKTAVGKGQLFLIGGAFHPSVTYEEVRGFGFGSLLKGGDIVMDDGAIGYRIGLGYT